jgi:pimeloyl-ACP methyl ester carboxylesterase
MPARWGATTVSDGVAQRRFWASRGTQQVPAVLWLPAEPAGRCPLVLIGHGGAGHKLDESRVTLSRLYATQYGCATVAIDGPWHGERARPGDRDAPAIANEVVDSMVADWRAVLDAVSAIPEVDGARVAYGGMSMGTMFGIPLVAAEPRIGVAVLGLCGLVRADGEPLGIGERLAADAPNVHCPAFYVVQWDDELFTREGQFALFDLLGAEDKRLYASRGGHAEAPDHARTAAAAFLALQLTATTMESW